MDRKPQVGEVYDVRVTVVAVGAGSIDVDIVGCPSDYRSVFLLKDFTAHATLVKAAEPPPLKVGDMVRGVEWFGGRYPIVFIHRDMALLEYADGSLSKPFKLSELRRAEPT